MIYSLPYLHKSHTHRLSSSFSSAIYLSIYLSQHLSIYLSEHLHIWITLSIVCTGNKSLLLLQLKMFWNHWSRIFEEGTTVNNELRSNCCDRSVNRKKDRRAGCQGKDEVLLQEKRKRWFLYIYFSFHIIKPGWLLTPAKAVPGDSSVGDVDRYILYYLHALPNIPLLLSVVLSERFAFIFIMNTSRVSTHVLIFTLFDSRQERLRSISLPPSYSP